MLLTPALAMAVERLRERFARAPGAGVIMAP
jgi:hypothetical protein